MTDIETGTDHLLARIEDGVAVLTLNRPERRNALSDQMIGALATTLAQVEADDAVGAVVLTGAGGAFCAGGDVKGFAERSPGAPEASKERLQRANQRATSGRLWRMPKPTIAVLPGAAAGAGLSLALACDLRYAASSAVLTTAFARVALAGDYGSAWFLVRLVGPARARELLYLSPRLTADEALQMGLVNVVVPPDALEREAMAVAHRLANGPSMALASMKENVALALTAPLDEYMDVEVTHHLATFATDDHAEAARAFVEKRDPVFGARGTRPEGS
ncbi:2-(1,2-epoxy-1,2-dihydrophenyl)acetyl-CoA isomerase [Blastococcus aurantiacus]|uniref:2-(1,2-epoxy-1,2-dihydrophenyl)acetyl-CoA isomerase n=1 Tax=Blastococcus aurantiacus TaxID=1550231 RepID=A0A1G7R1N6_9ACTN|nr:enoyl-CoA hydratase-related protein [Blastococcus aurantiacus]SDG04039.1 2-(1,2-epoxy-1,2-dihydrophenyl)acetyl-CoA isomerase [Blastococcus aurantiacus]